MSDKKIKKKILVVDDDLDILDSLQIILEMEGYEVIALVSTDRIYGEIRLHKPSLILLDVWLPGAVDGAEVARFLKTHEEFNRIPIILISAISNMETAIKYSFANDFLAKPFGIDEVIKKVSKYA